MNLNITWNEEKYQEFIHYLKSISEIKYQEFNSKIVSTKYEMLGIRLPILRKISTDIKKGNYPSFLKYCTNTYYEEVLIRGFVLSKIKNLEEFMSYFYSYLDLIDNWAINDSFCNSLKIVNNHKEYFLDVIANLLNSKKEYHIRVGFILLLNNYVSEEYLNMIFMYLDTIESDYYYVNMAKAWLLCETFVKYQKETLNYLENNHLNKFTINKAISKIRDSYRVSKEMKEKILKYKK